MSPVEGQKVLGHSGAAMTMRYSHAEVERMRAGIERPDQLITGNPAPPETPPAAGNVIEYDFAAQVGA